jgi:hypothetical protein
MVFKLSKETTTKVLCQPWPVVAESIPRELLHGDLRAVPVAATVHHPALTMVSTDLHSLQTYVDYVITLVTGWSGEHRDDMYLTLDVSDYTILLRLGTAGMSCIQTSVPTT